MNIVGYREKVLSSNPILVDESICLSNREVLIRSALGCPYVRQLARECKAEIRKASCDLIRQMWKEVELIALN